MMSKDLYIQRIVDTCARNRPYCDIGVAMDMVRAEYPDERDPDLDAEVKAIIKEYEKSGRPLIMDYPVSFVDPDPNVAARMSLEHTMAIREYIHDAEMASIKKELQYLREQNMRYRKEENDKEGIDFEL